MATSKPETYKLTAPDGTKVEVTGETRRDLLMARGYTEAKAAARPSAPPDEKKSS
jgi:hypothetical protein